MRKMEKNNSTYLKVISILFAGLLTATGIIWNNSQKQLEKSLNQIDDLMMIINQMQQTMQATNYRIDMLQFRLDTLNNRLQAKEYDPYSTPKVK